MELPEGFANIPKWHKIIMESDMAQSFSKEYKNSKDKLSDKIIEAIERGMKYTSVEYNDALSKIDVANVYFNQFFHDYDAILTPSANGELPKDLSLQGILYFQLSGLSVECPALVYHYFKEKTVYLLEYS